MSRWTEGAEWTWLYTPLCQWYAPDRIMARAGQHTAEGV